MFFRLAALCLNAVVLLTDALQLVEKSDLIQADAAFIGHEVAENSSGTWHRHATAASKTVKTRESSSELLKVRLPLVKMGQLTAESSSAQLTAGNDVHSNLTDTSQVKANASATFIFYGESIAETRRVSQGAPEMIRKLGVPMLVLFVGLVLLALNIGSLIAKLMIFFGAQTFMNLYMKEVLSGLVLVDDNKVIGIPAPFIVTALQQVVCFLLLMIVVLASWYKPRKLQTRREYAAIAVVSVCFTLNIALNNFSLALLDLSVSLMIRSCSPLTTYITQLFTSQFTGAPVKLKSLVSICLLTIGVACGALVVYAKNESLPQQHHHQQTMYMGIAACSCSLLAAALELNIIGVIGTEMRLNAMDTICYMALPATLLLVVPTCFWRHPVSWNGYGQMTDLEIFCEVMRLRPKVLVWAVLSGFFALAYNFTLYSIAQSLSATHAAMASNFNKTAVIACAFFAGLEKAPDEPWFHMLVMGVMGNAVAFTFYSYVESRPEAAPRKLETPK